MNIAVCIKQVPDTTEIKIDPVKNTLIRKGVPSIMNPFDKHALELALHLKDIYGAKVTALSMGPQQAKAVIREALSMGADEGYLITDRKFGGSDTYATSHILSAAIKHLGGFDIILGGKQAIDGDTGQTASSIAEHLSYPRVSQIASLTLLDDEESVEIKRLSDDGIEILVSSLPLVCTVVKEANKPRYPSIQSTLDSLEADIPELTLEVLEAEIDPAKIGLKGSPTRVKASFVPERTAEGVHIEGSPKQQAQELHTLLKDAKLVD
ncbi:MAG: electron transfer flavoprotein subunit beta/FixA family protein [Anaerotardibacter sp.]